MQSAQKQAGLEAVFDLWRRRKWLSIVVFAGVFAAAGSVAVFPPDIYASKATILVERQQVPEAFVQSTVTSGVEARLQTITQQVLSRSRLEGLISRFNLYADLRQQVPLEDVIDRMRKDIVLEQTEHNGQKRGRNADTVAFAIGYRGRNAQQVAQVANTLASFYIDENLKVREQQAAGTAEFLHTQLLEIKQRLEDHEQRLGQFKERAMGELPEQLQANIAVLEGLNTQLRLNGDKRARTSEQRSALAHQLAELEGLITRKTTAVTAINPNADTDPKPDSSMVRLEKLQQQLATLRTRYSEKYPDIIWLKAEIATLEQPLSTTHSTQKQDQGTEQQGQGTEPQLNPYIQQLKKEFGTLDAEIKALHAEEQSLLQSIALYKQRVENSPRRDQEWQVLKRDYDTAKDLYQSLLKRQEEAKLAQHLEQRQKGEQFRLLEPAIASGRAVEPKRGQLILMGLFLSLGCAVGAVFMIEHLHSSFHTVDDLRAFTQVPVLVSLPCIVIKADTRRRRWRFGLGGLATVLSLGLIVGASYVVIKGPAQLADLYTQMLQLRK